MGKIDDVQLLKMIREGKTGEECAAYFGVGNSTISRHKKKLEKEMAGSFAMMRTDALVKAAVEIREVDDLGVLVAQSRRTMDLVELALHGEDKESYEALRRLRRLSGQKNFVTMYTTMLKELRNQLEFYFTMRERVVGLKKVEDFQRTVLDAITECDPGTAQRIVKKLVEIQAIHSSLDLGVTQ
jgi:DNA-binding FadR family transcriptional regulator